MRPVSLRRFEPRNQDCANARYALWSGSSISTSDLTRWAPTGHVLNQRFEQLRPEDGARVVDEQPLVALDGQDVGRAA